MAGLRQLRADARREHKAAEALNPATPAMIARAEKLGRKAFNAGKYAPAQDAKILDMCHNRPYNTSMKLMTAWNKGWTAEHIKKSDAELAKQGW